MNAADAEAMALYERDEELRAIAGRIEALRVLLPGAAASAAIFLGTVAREIRYGADGKR